MSDQLAGGSARASFSRQSVLSAAVRLVSAHGYDSVSLSAVIDESEVSRRTLYAHFESLAAILAEAWLESGAEWLAHLVDEGFPAMVSMRDECLIEIVSLAHRVPELYEVVAPDVAELWARRPADRIEEAVWTWRLAIALGDRLTLHSRTPRKLGYVALLDALSIPSEPVAIVADEVSPPIPVHGPLDIQVEDPVTRRILFAAIDVLGRSGVANMSALRIGRRARVSSGAIKARFPGRDEIVARAFETIVTSVLEQNLAAFGHGEWALVRVLYGQSIKAALGPNRAPWRRFRRELFLAARHNAALAERVGVALDRTDWPLKQTLLNAGVSESAADAGLALNRSLTEGLAILHDLDIFVDTVDHIAATARAAQGMSALRT